MFWEEGKGVGYCMQDGFKCMLKCPKCGATQAGPDVVSGICCECLHDINREFKIFKRQNPTAVPTRVAAPSADPGEPTCTGPNGRKYYSKWQGEQTDLEF